MQKSSEGRRCLIEIISRSIHTVDSIVTEKAKGGIIMTDKEKVDHYDSLQYTIQVQLRGYKKLKHDADVRISKGIPSMTDGYNRGLSKAYGQIIKDLSRFICEDLRGYIND